MEIQFAIGALALVVAAPALFAFGAIAFAIVRLPASIREARKDKARFERDMAARRAGLPY